MNWNQLEGHWTQLCGKLLEQWGRFTHSDVVVIEGKRAQVVGLLRREYGVAERHHERTEHNMENLPPL